MFFSYLRLLKLLYIADREHLVHSHRPIVGTRIVAMNNGPLHSEIYNLIKGEDARAQIWADHIRKEGYEVELVRDPGLSELSASEVRTLTGVSEKYSSFNDWDLVELTHDFPEWLKNSPEESANTSHPISFEDLLVALGLSADKDAILEDAEEGLSIDRMFSWARTQSAKEHSQPAS